MVRRIPVSDRKLARQKVVGLAHYSGGRRIEIDPRQKPKEWLSTLIHEALHMALPKLEEDEVLRAEKIIAETMWGAGIRRVHVK